ncbi:MAG TPA: sigma 54-interacting transcriptional regulator [Polyangiaceae bacterium]|nr:sigma 54-interacting transcriptional regulator [Polyangiaceae bacterium]
MKVEVATMPPPPRVAYEVMIYVRQETRTVELVPNSVAGVGRGADNVIRVEDPSVSRHHAALHVGDEVQVEDLGSANGTMLVRSAHGAVEEETTGGSSHPIAQGERITLEVGDVLRVGQVVLVLQRKGRTSMPPAAPGLTPGQPVLVDPEMRRAYELLKRAAATEISVLLLGETGAGKEVMAETVHRWSLRSDGPFLKLNCAALTDTLLESELFGHERGAFTGAHAAKEGLLESTDGGTVFLDEIGEISAGLQAKLLRVLEERAVIRVGSTKPRRINVRFVTATNRDLAARVQGGHFRSDLYYRISGLVIRIPPLRQRPSEIEPLARHFLREFSMRAGQPIPTLSASALGKLLAHDWPGNVRELRNVMERATLLVTGHNLEAEHVMIENHQADSTDLFDAEFEAETAVMTSPFLEASSPEDEKARILKALEACGGNQTRAAKMLGIARRTLINRIEQFNLPRPKKG